MADSRDSLSRRDAIKVGIGVGVTVLGRLPDDALRRRMVEFYDAL